MSCTRITILGLISPLNSNRKGFSYVKKGLKSVVLFCSTKRKELISKGVTVGFLENVHASVTNM